MDEVTRLRQQREREDEAWFQAHWDELDEHERRAVAALIRRLHDEVEPRPAAVAWLAERGC